MYSNNITTKTTIVKEILITKYWLHSLVPDNPAYLNIFQHTPIINQLEITEERKIVIELKH